LEVLVDEWHRREIDGHCASRRQIDRNARGGNARAQRGKLVRIERPIARALERWSLLRALLQTLLQTLLQILLGR
jgi:hypothetical protein